MTKKTANWSCPDENIRNFSTKLDILAHNT